MANLISRQLSEDPNIPDVQFKLFKTKDYLKPLPQNLAKATLPVKGRLNLFGDDFDFEDNATDIDIEDDFKDLELSTAPLLITKTSSMSNQRPLRNAVSLIEEEDPLILMISDDTKFEKYVPKTEVLVEEEGMFDGVLEKRKNSQSSNGSLKIEMLDNRSS
jgi:hypothetical protein